MLKIKKISENSFKIIKNTGKEYLHNPYADSAEEELIYCNTGNIIYLNQINIIKEIYPAIKINFAI
ncbi:MAG: hypothetical protein ACYDDE_00710 [bacterium]